MKRWMIIAVVVLVLAGIVYWIYAKRKANASGLPAGAWYPWNRTPKPDSYFGRNADGTVDYGHTANGAPIPIG